MMTTSWDVVQRRTPRRLCASAPGVDRSLSAELPVSPAWTERALCAQTDPDAFFPEVGGWAEDVKKLCRSCPVRGECLEYALELDDRFGIWGGLSVVERRKVKRLRRAGWTIETTHESDDPDSPESLDLLSPQRRRVPLDAWLAAPAGAGGGSR